MTAPQESFKPVRLRFDHSASGRALFALRLTVDLQAATIYAFLRDHLPALRGTVLDVGCGDSPFAHLVSPEAKYVGIDVEGAAEFGFTGNESILRYDGETLPFEESSIDHILCTEVLEHVRDPRAFVREMRRVLKPGGSLIATVPFSARVHHAPYDFHRFTNFGLLALFEDFVEVAVTERGSDVTAVAAKLVVFAIRAAKPVASWHMIWKIPVAIVASGVAVLAVGAAHAALALGIGSPTDPLGYGVRAVKPISTE